MTETGLNKVLFVCTGNFYRSRLAELLFGHYALDPRLGWIAESRGLTERNRHKGLSPVAWKFLRAKGLEHLTEEPREPRVISIDDLESSQLVVALNRLEHEPMLLARFGQIPRMMEKQGTLRYWNVDDLPPPGLQLNQWLRQLASGRQPLPGQREESGTEHIDFAVQALIREIREKSP